MAAKSIDDVEAQEEEAAAAEEEGGEDEMSEDHLADSVADSDKEAGKMQLARKKSIMSPQKIGGGASGGEDH